MAMDDIYRLVKAILVDGRMTKSVAHKYVDANVFPIEWADAEILDASITGNHRTGSFNGYARYSIPGIAGVGRALIQDDTFHTLWLQGWTSIEYRDMIMDADRARKCVRKLQAEDKKKKKK